MLINLNECTCSSNDKHFPIFEIKCRLYSTAFISVDYSTAFISTKKPELINLLLGFQ